MSYEHAEAFNLMKYKCETCNVVQTLWNSRDGVTPYIVNCKQCNGKSVHLIGQDTHDPEFGNKLREGMFPSMRVFVNMTKEKAMTFAERRLKAFESSKYAPPAEGTSEREELLTNVTEDIYHSGEAPDLITGAEYVALTAVIQ